MPGYLGPGSAAFHFALCRERDDCRDVGDAYAIALAPRGPVGEVLKGPTTMTQTKPIETLGFTGSASWAGSGTGHRREGRGRAPHRRAAGSDQPGRLWP